MIKKIIFNYNTPLRSPDVLEHPKTLQSISAGESALVIAIDGGRKASARLEDLGILPGVMISVLANAHGPLLVSVGESRVMVERGVAGKVFVV